MKYRKLGKTGFEITEISLGTWPVDCSPGASSPEQLMSNLGAATLPALDSREMVEVKRIYDDCLRKDIHPLW